MANTTRGAESDYSERRQATNAIGDNRPTDFMKVSRGVNIFAHACS